MARTAVSIFSRQGAVKRPSRAPFMRMACPRDLVQLPQLLLGIAIALFVLGHLFVTARVPGAVSLEWAAAVFLAGFLIFNAAMWLLGRLKGVGTARLDARRRETWK